MAYSTIQELRKKLDVLANAFATEQSNREQLEGKVQVLEQEVILSFCFLLHKLHRSFMILEAL